MRDFSPAGYSYPSTRYSGSKRRLLSWIWECLNDIRFESVLDVFGGTASTALLFKRYGKKVHFNDLLKCNQIIGKAVIENSTTKVTSEDIEFVLAMHDVQYPTFIEETFQGLYFLDHENTWLDK